MLLYELLPKIKHEINDLNFDIKSLTKSMKSKLKKGEYELLRTNQELIDFIIRY